MAVSVALPGIFVTDATNPPDTIALDGTLTDTPNTGGRVGLYGGSGGPARTRWISGQQKTRKVSVALDTVTPTQLAWLEAKLDALIILRDPTGRRYFVSYAGFTATPFQVLGWHSVGSLDFWQITRFESV